MLARNLLRAACAAVTLLCAVAGAVGSAAQSPRVDGTTTVPAWRAAGNVAIVTVHGEVDQVTRASVLRRIADAKTAGAQAIVLELDTPGGDLSATLEICLALKDDAATPVYAWVHPKAFSAGTILALACRGILVSPNAVFGDAAPIQAIPGLGLNPLPTAERAKIEAPVLAEVVDSARRRGYDETLVRTFVTTQEEAWMLRNRQTDERIFVGRPEYRAAFGEDPPTMRTSGDAFSPTRAAAQGAYTVQPAYDDRFRAASEVAADAETGALAARDEHVTLMQLRPPSRQPLTPEHAADWELVTQVDGAEELLVVYAPEARAFGLAQETVATDGDIAAYFGAVRVWRINEHWGDALVRFLTSWPVRLVLVVVLLAGFLVEIAVPGLGWFGAAAAVALVLLLGAPLLAGLQNWWPVVLVCAGAGLVLVEVFIIPGFGVAGIVGAGCVLIGLIAAFIGAPLNTPAGQSDLTNALAVVVGGGIVSAATAWAVVRILPRTRLANSAILHAHSGDAGDSVHGRSTGLPAMSTPARRVQPGAIGTTITPLRPVGKVSFDGVLVEVQSVGGYIDEGRTVIVVRSSAYAVEVEERRA